MDLGDNAKPTIGSKGAKKKGKAEPLSEAKGKLIGEEQPQKSKARLKAERRALQEAQRVAKGGAATGNKEAPKGGGKPSQQPKSEGKKPQTQVKKPTSDQTQPMDASKSLRRIPDNRLIDDPGVRKRIQKKLDKQQIPQRTVVQRKVGLFNHLHQYEREVSLTKDISFGPGNIHPAILKLGLQYAEGVICGSNARCIALLAALKQVITDYKTPPQKELSRDLESKLKPCITFLTQCRPLSVSMGSAIKHVKWHITNSPGDLPENDAKSRLIEVLHNFLNERIILASKVISENACQKIRNGDVIMVYACSSLIRRVLCDAHQKGIQFKVIVVDSRPKLEGKEMLKWLVKEGLKCSYILINAVSYSMREVTKLLLGAHALLANGYVMSRVGSSQVAMVAKASNVPVLVCCETYKFCERVQTDSFVFNELGDPEDLVSVGSHKVAHLDGWRGLGSLSLLNLVYDVTPSDLVTMVITEVGMVPCTSVPVVLRVKQTEAEVMPSS